MKKKLMIPIIILVILIFLFCAIKLITYHNIYSHMKKNYEITNFEVTESSKNFEYILTRKDNTIVYKTYSIEENDIIHTFTFYTDGTTNYVFNETNKTYKITDEDNLSGLKHLYTKLEFPESSLSFLDEIKESFTTKISKVKKDGIECYHIIRKIEDKKFEYDISCEDYLLVYSNNLTFSNYRLNSITDEDVMIPNLEDYTLSY